MALCLPPPRLEHKVHIRPRKLRPQQASRALQLRQLGRPGPFEEGPGRQLNHACHI